MRLHKAASLLVILSPALTAEVNYLRLGGFDQWVMIRGANVANPPLIELHGGPGFSDIRIARTKAKGGRW